MGAICVEVLGEKQEIAYVSARVKNGEYVYELNYAFNKCWWLDENKYRKLSLHIIDNCNKLKVYVFANQGRDTLVENVTNFNFKHEIRDKEELDKYIKEFQQTVRCALLTAIDDLRKLDEHQEKLNYCEV